MLKCSACYIEVQLVKSVVVVEINIYNIVVLIRLHTPSSICKYVNNFNKIRNHENCMLFIFSTVLKKVFHITDVYILHKTTF